MVPNLSIVTLSISALLSILLPIILVIYLYKKMKISIKAVLIGALIFLVFQIFTRIPMLNYLSLQEWYIKASANKWFLALFLGLTAGLFEEVGRFLGFKYLLNNNLEWKNGIAFGIGHGGIESILLAGLTAINYIIYSVLMNSGTFDIIWGSQLPANTADVIKNILTNSPPAIFLLIGIERVLAICAHIGFSMLVLYAVMYRKNIFLIYAILLHAILDIPAVLISSKVVLYIYVFIFAVVSIVLTIKSKKYFECADNTTPVIE